MSDKFAGVVDFMLRTPAVTHVRGRVIDVVEAHNEIVAKLGKVALGKFGHSGSKTRADRLQKQIEDGYETRLLLVSKVMGNFCGFKAPLSAISFGRPTSDMVDFTPPYYRELDEQPLLWFIASGPFVETSLSRLHLATNDRPLLNVLGQCRTSTMLIYERPPRAVQTPPRIS